MTHKANHHSVSVISRSKAHTATAAVAYATGTLVADERTGLTHDYRRKAGRLSTEVIGYNGSAGQLANAAELAENRRNSCVGRSTKLALPDELSLDSQQALTRGYALWLNEQYGCASVVAIHAPDRGGDQRNTHAHIYETDRRVDPDTGEFGAKIRAMNIANGGREQIELRRAEWARRVNRELDKTRAVARVDHRSLKRRGDAGDAPKGLLPALHLGAAKTALLRQRQAEAKRTKKDPVPLLGFEAEVLRRARHNQILWGLWGSLQDTMAQQTSTAALIAAHSPPEAAQVPQDDDAARKSDIHDRIRARAAYLMHRQQPTARTRDRGRER